MRARDVVCCWTNRQSSANFRSVHASSNAPRADAASASSSSPSPHTTQPGGGGGNEDEEEENEDDEEENENSSAVVRRRMARGCAPTVVAGAPTVTHATACPKPA